VRLAEHLSGPLSAPSLNVDQKTMDAPALRIAPGDFNDERVVALLAGHFAAMRFMTRTP